MKTGLIFDMDGTVWDSSANVALSWAEQVKKSGYCRPDITQKDIMGVMGLTMNRIADILFGDLGIEERMKLLQDCCEYENSYLRIHGGNLYPELENTLAKLAEDNDLFIVSNCQSGYIEAFLDYYGFWKYFKDIECYGNNHFEKGDNISLIVKRNRLQKAYYIGDIQGDYDATMKAGINFIHAAYGFGTINCEVPRLEQFSELPSLLKKID
ncbi:MAG: HAD family hydrolase [Lachnospiraceae bacterium]|nr:HAD family hydrolase [Lachnospiraceae bacterium]